MNMKLLLGYSNNNNLIAENVDRTTTYTIKMFYQM
jgi:hypothetical protein